MGVLRLLAISVVATFVPGVPEGTLILYVTKLHWSPVLAVTVFTAGECVVFSAMYWGGDELVRRWAWFARKIGAVRERYAAHLESRFLILAVLSATIGLPPPVALAALGSGFGVPFRHLFPVLYVGRFARFLVMALFGVQLAQLWHRYWP